MFSLPLTLVYLWWIIIGVGTRVLGVLYTPTFSPNYRSWHISVCRTTELAASLASRLYYLVGVVSAWGHSLATPLNDFMPGGQSAKASKWLGNNLVGSIQLRNNYPWWVSWVKLKPQTALPLVPLFSMFGGQGVQRLYGRTLTLPMF